MVTETDTYAAQSVRDQTVEGFGGRGDNADGGKRLMSVSEDGRMGGGQRRQTGMGDGGVNGQVDS